MIRLSLMLLLILSALSFSAIAETERDLVIVTGKNSEITSLTVKELRRMYLGLNVVVNDESVTPIRNYSNDVLHEMFLQKIMFMSSRTYQRQLNLRTIKKGLKPPTEVTTHKAIVDALTADKNSIAYMWHSQARSNPDIRILTTH
ncbi:MAG: hypothetical protein OEX07_06190 [Gammaproteobacteria bacterium]|nr:hypothetical protein [Gammaproteobacteria bacterium]